MIIAHTYGAIYQQQLYYGLGIGLSWSGSETVIKAAQALTANTRDFTLEAALRDAALTANTRDFTLTARRP